MSRRMLVFSTDAGFHYAGDGKVNFSVVLLSSLPPPPPPPRKQSRERGVMWTKSMVKILDAYSTTKTMQLGHELLVGHSKTQCLFVCKRFLLFIFFSCITPNNDQIFGMMKEVTLRKKKEMHLENVVCNSASCCSLVALFCPTTATVTCTTTSTQRAPTRTTPVSLRSRQS